jgi:hypothetical protein
MESLKKEVRHCIVLADYIYTDMRINGFYALSAFVIIRLRSDEWPRFCHGRFPQDWLQKRRFFSKRHFVMTHVQVFDPPMCCSSGVCGLAVNPVLPQFAADLDWLRSQGVQVERYGLSQQPNAFVETDAVQRTLSSEGTNCLPLVLVNGQIVTLGTYPNREELASYAGIDAQAEGIHTDAIAEDCGSDAGGCCGSEVPLTFISAKKSH